MNRKKFLAKLLGTGAFISLAGSATFLESCRRDNSMMPGMGSSDISVIEGGFNIPLPLIPYSSPQNIIAKNNAAQIIQGHTTNVLGYGNGILGPAFRVNSGDTVNIDFQNQLSEGTNIHWHGLIIPAAMDGHPSNSIQPGNSFHYSFQINQRAGTYWFHPHPDMRTAYQVYMGLAGLMIVNDAEEAALNLPADNYEVPLVIQDKRMDSAGNLIYAPNAMDQMNGYLGQYVLINGIYAPYLKVSTCWYRFRIINGSTSRIYNLSLSNGADFTVIGSDGGLLSITEKAASLLVAPGERADILIDFTNYHTGTELYIKSSPFAGGNGQGGQSFKIMKLVVDNAININFSLPSALSSITPVSPSTAVRTRIFDLKQSGMMSGMRHTINGKTFDNNRVDATVQAGTTEIWVFDNTGSNEIHPMHIHGVQFQVLERTGGRGQLIATEKGWKDTILLLAGEKVNVIIAFPKNKGIFVLHCHNLEHEDNGMMSSFEIV